ncbi:MAG: DUF190 domain-containing protein [Hydrogenophilaceae bacterium]|nr:DUF190 domain-containing protein [Hydrogenophilaceae bacterium]
MDGLCVRFYTQEGMRHQGRPIYDWLFDQARAQGIAGGTAFRAHAGFGRHGLHQDTFFELAGTLPECVEFFAEADRIQTLIQAVSEAGLALPYLSYAVAFGVTGR